MRAAGAVLVEGPKWCGKTWTGMAHANSAIWVADPTSDYLTRRMATSDPLSLLVGERPVLIDEWQDAPGLWDAVRLSLDRSPGTGQFLLTGSATPRDRAVSHSGTGRIVRTTMWPMTLTEAGVTDGRVSLTGLLDGQTPPTIRGAWQQSDVINAVVKGGWPGTIDMPVDDAAKLADNYLQSVAYVDATQIDGIRRDPTRLAALLSALARNTSTLVSNVTLARDMADEAVSTKTVAHYLDVLRRLHVLHEIPAWAPALRSPVRLRQAPKRILCDPSLAVAGMHATRQSLASDPKPLGFLFENLCLRDLSAYAGALPGAVFHYHDDSQLEVDAIIQADDGRWMGVEIKLSADKEDAAAAALLALAAKMANTGQPAPAALVILTGYDGFAHRRPDGVITVPIDQLGM